MIGHENVRMDANRQGRAELIQQPQVERQVGLAVETPRTVVSPLHHVQWKAGYPKSRMAGHTRSTRHWGQRATRESWSVPGLRLESSRGAEAPLGKRGLSPV
jgi:hypothetical protein